MKIEVKEKDERKRIKNKNYKLGGQSNHCRILNKDYKIGSNGRIGIQNEDKDYFMKRINKGLKRRDSGVIILGFIQRFHR